jgi:hypothetical protein
MNALYDRPLMKTAILVLLGVCLISLGACAHHDTAPQSSYQSQTTSSYGK